MNTPPRKEHRLRDRALRAACVMVFLVAAVMYCGCSGTKETAAQQPRPKPSSLSTGSLMVKMQSGRYMIKIGDMVELSVLGYPEFQCSTTVKESGAIMIPLLGEIHAAGLTKLQLTETLRKTLAEFVKGEPEISIDISSPAHQKISILGVVTRQDNYPLTGEISLIDALAAAGGTTPESDLEHVQIIHRGNLSDSTEVDLSALLEAGNLDGVPMVQAGDVIYVPRRENLIREMSTYLTDVVFLLAAFRLLY